MGSEFAVLEGEGGGGEDDGGIDQGVGADAEGVGPMDAVAGDDFVDEVVGLEVGDDPGDEAEGGLFEPAGVAGFVEPHLAGDGLEVAGEVNHEGGGDNEDGGGGDGGEGDGEGGGDGELEPDEEDGLDHGGVAGLGEHEVAEALLVLVEGGGGIEQAVFVEGGMFLVPEDADKDGGEEKDHEGEEGEEAEVFAEEEFEAVDGFGQGGVERAAFDFGGDELGGAHEGDEEAADADDGVGEVFEEFEFLLEGELGEEIAAGEHDQAEEDDDVEGALAQSLSEGIGGDGGDDLEGAFHGRGEGVGVRPGSSRRK